MPADAPARRTWALADVREAALAAVAFLALIEGLRALLPYVDPVFRAFVTGRPADFSEGARQTALFLLGGLVAVAAPLLHRRLAQTLRPRAALLVFAGAAGLARAALALAEGGMPRFWAAVALVAALGLVLPAVLERAARREAGGTVGVGLVLAFLYDVASGALGATFDLTLRPDVPGAGVAVAVALVALAVASPDVPPPSRARIPRAGSGHRALLLGVSLFLGLHLFLAPAPLARYTSVPYFVAAPLVFVAVLAGAGIHASRRARRRFAWPLAFAPALAVVALLLPSPLLPLALALAVLAAATVVDAMASLLTAEMRATSGRRPSFWTGALVVLVVLAAAEARTFARAPEYGGGVLPQVVVLFAAALLFVPGALLAREGPSRPRSGPRFTRAAAVALAVLTVAPALGLATGLAPRAVAEAPSADGFVVVSYNVRQGVRIGGVIDWEALADALRPLNASVVALQEVEAGRASRANADGAEYLARALGMHAAFGPTVGRSSGNAVLSRFPILEHENVVLPDDTHPRAVVRARLDLGDGRVVDAYSTHLGFRTGERDRQGDVIARMVETAGVPAIVAGDFNSWGDDTAGRDLLDVGMHRSQDLAGAFPPPTFTTLNPRAAIDFVFATPDFAFTEHRVVDVVLSDHFPVLAAVEPRRAA